MADPAWSSVLGLGQVDRPWCTDADDTVPVVVHCTHASSYPAVAMTLAGDPPTNPPYPASELAAAGPGTGLLSTQMNDVRALFPARMYPP